MPSPKYPRPWLNPQELRDAWEIIKTVGAVALLFLAVRILAAL